MPDQRQYALVAYIRSALGEFVESLRAELHPAHAHLPAHITVLPPRLLSGSEDDAVRLVHQVCQHVAPFDVSLGDVENFMPVTPTVFIQVAFAGYRVRELHDALNTGALYFNEQWKYMPHLTIVKLDTMDAANRALEIARNRWAKFTLPRKATISELTFVRQGEDANHWVDLAPVPLGGKAAIAR